MVLENLILVLLISFSLFSCDQQEAYDPNQYLSEEQKQELLLEIIPYSAKLPKKFTYERRLEPVLDTFYVKEVKKYGLQHYYISPKDSFHYFMLHRIAPSLYEKKIAIAGKFKKNAAGNIKDYEEVFWTFKMKKEELDKKGKILFEEMIKGNDLSAYLPGKKEEEWIEFPDERCSYDKKEQRWKVNLGSNVVLDQMKK